MTTTQAHKRHNYFSGMLIGDTVIQTMSAAENRLSRVDFDTFVVIGLSGALAGGLMAQALKKNLYVLRKPEDSTHDGLSGFGLMGTRWVFLDDFVSSGSTYKRAIEQVEGLYDNGVWDERVWMPRAERWQTKRYPKLTHVGGYFYNDSSFETLDTTKSRCYAWPDY